MAKLKTILAAHRDPSRLSASQVPIAAGVSSWKSPLDLYLLKLDLLDEEEQDDGGEAAYWGTRLEPVVLEEYAKREGTHVLGQDKAERPVLFDPDGTSHSHRTKKFRQYVAPQILSLITDTLRHPSIPVMAHLDGLRIDNPGGTPDAIVQAKTAGYWARQGWAGEEGTDEIPDYVLLQVHTEALAYLGAVGEFLPVHVPVLLGGQRFLRYQVTPDDDLLAVVARVATEFLTRVDNLDPPPAEGTRDGSRALGVLYKGEPEDPPLIPTLGSELDLLVSGAAQAKKEADLASGRYQALVVKIQEAMTQRTKLHTDRARISWSPSKPQDRTDWKAVATVFKDHLPDVYASTISKHTKTTDGPRRFTLSIQDKDRDHE